MKDDLKIIKNELTKLEIDVLKNKKELLEETFTTQAVIRRIKSDENEVETIPVFLKAFLNSTPLMLNDFK